VKCKATGCHRRFSRYLTIAHEKAQAVSVPNEDNSMLITFRRCMVVEDGGDVKDSYPS
jgi:hypothetical protein